MNSDYLAAQLEELKAKSTEHHEMTEEYINAALVNQEALILEAKHKIQSCVYRMLGIAAGAIIPALLMYWLIGPVPMVLVLMLTGAYGALLGFKALQELKEQKKVIQTSQEEIAQFNQLLQGGIPHITQQTINEEYQFRRTDYLEAIKENQEVMLDDSLLMSVVEQAGDKAADAIRKAAAATGYLDLEVQVKGEKVRLLDNGLPKTEMMIATTNGRNRLVDLAQEAAMCNLIRKRINQEIADLIQEGTVSVEHNDNRLIITG